MISFDFAIHILSDKLEWLEGCSACASDLPCTVRDRCNSCALCCGHGNISDQIEVFRLAISSLEHDRDSLGGDVGV